MILKDFYTKTEIEELVSEVSKSMTKECNNRKNVFDWFIKNPEFCFFCAKFADDPEPERSGEGLSFGSALVLISICCHKIQTGKDSISEEKILSWTNCFIYNSVICSLVLSGLIEVKCNSKWMSPSGKTGMRLTEKGLEIGRSIDELPDDYVLQLKESMNNNKKN